LGVGILTTAQKQEMLHTEHDRIALESMCKLNTAGMAFGQLDGVTAMTDVTGFGLLGHLIEICEGSKLGATINESALPVFEQVEFYRQLDCIPGGTKRNFDSYGHKAVPLSERQKQILCDPQTSGGLLVAVEEASLDEFHRCAHTHGLQLEPIGQLHAHDGEFTVQVG
jgi:selenide,water dikinase